MIKEDEEMIEPYDTDDSLYDEEGLTPRALSKLKVQKRKHKKAWEAQELAKQQANRASNQAVWEKYLDNHEPMVFFPETAKVVAEMSKTKSKTLIYPDGKEYRGLTKGIKPEGEGTMQWPDGGGSYVGQWKSGLPHGHGRRIYANGESYVGRWQNGRRHGFGIITDKLNQEVLYEGLWREDSKAHQEAYAAGLPSSDRTCMQIARSKFNNISSIASAADLMVEKMISAPTIIDSGPRYFGSKNDAASSTKKKQENRKIKKRNNTSSNTSYNKNKDLNERKEIEDNAAANVSAYYVKKEKLKNIKNAWHPYPSPVYTQPSRKIAAVKVDNRIKNKYGNMLQNIENKNDQLELSLQAIKSIYNRERKALLNDYARGLELLHIKFQKQRQMTLKMGIMRGGVAIDRSVKEVKKLKNQYIEKNDEMMKRRQRSIIRMKEEYFNDIAELKRNVIEGKILEKKKYLRLAYSRYKLEVEQESKDIEREFVEERRIEREKRTQLRIKEALSGQVVKKSQNADNELEDNDGKKAKRLYQLSLLQKAITPSLRQELKIAWQKWIRYNNFCAKREKLRLNLVNLEKKDNSTTTKKVASPKVSTANGTRKDFVESVK